MPARPRAPPRSPACAQANRIGEPGARFLADAVRANRANGGKLIRVDFDCMSERGKETVSEAVQAARAPVRVEDKIEALREQAREKPFGGAAKDLRSVIKARASSHLYWAMSKLEGRDPGEAAMPFRRHCHISGKGVFVSPEGYYLVSGTAVDAHRGGDETGA